MNNIYVLKLQHNNYYIGKSSSRKSRLDSHFSGHGSLWTQLHSPLSILETFEDKGFDELATTLRYMKLYGIDNVRGADYVLPSLTKEQKREIELHMASENNACFICHKVGHFTYNCPNKRKKHLRFVI